MLRVWSQSRMTLNSAHNKFFQKHSHLCMQLWPSIASQLLLSVHCILPCYAKCQKVSWTPLTCFPKTRLLLLGWHLRSFSFRIKSRSRHQTYSSLLSAWGRFHYIRRVSIWKIVASYDHARFFLLSKASLAETTTRQSIPGLSSFSFLC